MIPGAKVVLVETSTGVTKQLTTNDAGLYDAVSVITGTYKLTFSKEGFGALVRDGVTVDVGVTTINAQLAVGTAVQEVDVTGQATLLKTETGQQGTTLPKESMAQLPNVGQDWANFTKTLPGVEGSGAGVSVNGNMPYNSNFLTDGGAITYPQSSNVDTAIFETVAEVQVNTAGLRCAVRNRRQRLQPDQQERNQHLPRRGLLVHSKRLLQRPQLFLAGGPQSALGQLRRFDRRAHQEEQDVLLFQHRPAGQRIRLVPLRHLSHPRHAGRQLLGIGLSGCLRSGDLERHEPHAVPR